MKKVSVITSAYNRVDDLQRCIDSVLTSDYLDYECIVVDNASTDGTKEVLEKKYGNQITLISLEKNMFSTGGKNAGIEVAEGEYLWFVDSDMIVPPILMKDLVEVLDNDSTIGMAGARIYYYKDKSRLWSDGASINLYTSMAKTVSGEFREACLTEVPVIMCGYMIRKDVLRKIGCFDDSFKIVFEESDLAMKVRKLGYHIMLLNDKKIYHNVELPEEVTEPLRFYNMETDERAYYFARNRDVYMKKYANLWGKIIYFVFFRQMFCAYYVYIAFKFKKPKRALAYIKGLEGKKLSE